MSWANKHLTNFIKNCNQVIADLDSAYRVEMMDACTSDNSFGGFLISLLSSSRNYAVAQSVNNLQYEAQRINKVLVGKDVFNRKNCMPIRENFTGSFISQAESNEHNFFANCLTRGLYSEVSSLNTMNSISYTRQQIEYARLDAELLQKQLKGSSSMSST